MAERLLYPLEEPETGTRHPTKYKLPYWMRELDDAFDYDEEEAPEEPATPAYNGMLDMYLKLPFGISRTRYTYTGTFEELAEGLCFVLSEELGSHILSVTSYNPRLQPLFDHLVQNKLSMKLTVRSGKTERELEVLDLVQADPASFPHKRSGGLSEKDPEQPLFRSIVNRILTSEQTHHKPVSRRKLFTAIGDLRCLLDVCRNTYPPEIADWAEENLSRYDNDSEGFGSDGKKHILNALIHILNIDWSITPPQLRPLSDIKAELDALFYGLDAVKIRLLEVIAQLQHTQTLPKWGILLCGPAGTGKSTIARTFARILGLPHVSLDMSSICDIDALTGSSRIYSNAKPGYIVEKLFAAGTANAVVIINELDKSEGRADKTPPSDALLTLMDGLGFIDNFIEGVIPTNGLFFIATANDPEKISKPLMDRLLRIDIPSYSPGEKRVILKDYLFPQLLSENRLTPDDISLSEDAVKLLCSSYAVEPGVRDLHQYSEKIVSHYLLEAASGGPASVCYTAADIRFLLGPSNRIERKFTTRPGLVITAFSHDGSARTVPVEAVAFPGTGRLDTVNIPEGPIRDFCMAAYLCARRDTKGIDFSRLDISVHVPQELPETHNNFIGAAVYAAITSAVSNMEFLPDCAFIGGCDLYGNMFFDENNVSPFLNALAAVGVKTVYAPRGSSKLIYGSCADGTELVESDSMLNLIKLALCASATDHLSE